MRPEHELPPEDLQHRRTHRWQRASGWRRMRRRPIAIFFRFLFSFGLLVILSAALISFPLLAFTGRMPGPPALHELFRVLSCLFSLLIFAAIFFGVRRIFRSIAGPLGDVMEAADSVAAGDLTARVPESGGDVFRQLFRSFNRMAGELERADQQRRNLTADVAHELRNPLHIIQGNLEGILDGVYQADPAHIQNTLDETRLLSRLVDDLQTLSLAEAGQLHLHFESVQLAELLADVHTSFGGQADEQGVVLELEIEPAAVETTISADFERLQQVFGNLVANALRFTPAGGQIRISVSRHPDFVRIIVSDNGAGISQEDLPFIFDRFWKGDKARTRREGSGSGLGLAIARQLVRAHAGTIEVESESGRGTRFSLEFPLEERFG